MMFKIRNLLCLAVIPLAACGGDGAPEEGGPDRAGNTAAAVPAGTGQSRTSAAPTFADGADHCFDLLANTLGADTKIAKVTVAYSAGKDIDGLAMKPKGEMVSCEADYQNPEDPRKLLGVSMDMTTGEFREPRPIDIQVAGNAADFVLEDHLIALSDINYAGLPTLMAAQDEDLAKAYSDYAWGGITLQTPMVYRTPKPEHTFDLLLTGRLASNDVKNTAIMKVKPDARTIVSNNLLPD